MIRDAPSWGCRMIWGGKMGAAGCRSSDRMGLARKFCLTCTFFVTGGMSKIFGGSETKGSDLDPPPALELLVK